MVVRKATTAFQHFGKTVARIVFVFLVLSIGLDSMTRLFYSYAPIEIWMDLKSVEVHQEGDEALVTVKRKIMRQSIAVFHRSLMIRWPSERRGCTDSTITILDDPSVEVITVPIHRILSASCPTIIYGNSVEAVVQVSYIFEFPYGVKRLAVQYSNRFALSYVGGRYIVSDVNPK